MTIDLHARQYSIVVLLALLTACAPQAGRPPEATRLTVLAASSLTDAFDELARDFERQHPNISVGLTFAGSQILSLQIAQGAQADLFASADEAHMARLVNTGLVHSPRVIARSPLSLIVPAENPAGLRRFADLPRAKRIVMGTEHVPVGRYARQVLQRAGAALGQDFAARVRAHVVSEESNVRLVRAKVILGEADAAFVYRSDAVGVGRLQVLPIPEAFNVTATYVVGRLATSQQRESEAFVGYLASPGGRAVFARHGFDAEAP